MIKFNYSNNILMVNAIHHTFINKINCKFPITKQFFFCQNQVMLNFSLYEKKLFINWEEIILIII